MTVQSSSALSNLRAVRIEIRGQVQGIGMRPTIADFAQQLQLNGSVYNTTHGVAIELEGHDNQIDRFIADLLNRLPSAAVVEDVFVHAVVRQFVRGFRIRASDNNSGPLTTLVPRDLGVCDHCQSDILEPHNHRFQYPFTSCTNCGPRYSILTGMPWDRAATSMTQFRLCDICREEYKSVADRRFHAQTNACPRCGPRVVIEPDKTDERDAVSSRQPISVAANVINNGGIVAVKGLGGYQLICSATNSAAVERLRTIKQRPGKPLAVMVRSAEEARRLGVVDDRALTALTGPSNPIVLLHAHTTSGSLSDAVHPHLNHIGIFLPTTPLHVLLLNLTNAPCVVTSGNVKAASIAFRDGEADVQQLRGTVDASLTHDRDILRPVDDSVVRIIADRAVTLRCGRGLAPLPLPIHSNNQILAVGAHQKVAVALSNGHQAILGPHIGDLDSVPVRQRFVEQTERLCQLYRTEPELIVHDVHPDLFTTRWAAEQNCRTISVQHHHAHVVSAIVENRWIDREVLGVAFDGTGYGTDGTIWGGEFLLATTSDFRRIARIRPFRLPGGDSAVREPWRIALALLHQALGPEKTAARLQWLTPGDRQQAERLMQILGRSSAASSFPSTSSAGRLFDGIASLLLQIERATYEAEPAMRLESICDPTELGEYQFDISDGELIELDWRPLIRAIVADKLRRVPSGIIASRVNRSIAASIGRVCDRFLNIPVVLTGGCFQNALLTEQTEHVLELQQREVGLHAQIPPNDGGLAVGQLAVAAAQLQKGAI